MQRLSRAVAIVLVCRRRREDASSEQERVNAGGGSCAGQSHTDTHATGESAVFGTVSGNVAATLNSDDTLETITEVLSTGGSPATRFSRLEHRFSFTVPAGSRIELHVEGFRTASPDGDDFRFEWSTDAARRSPLGVKTLPRTLNAARPSRRPR